MSTPYTSKQGYHYASRCYHCTILILLQLRKLGGCTLRRMVNSSAAAQHALQGFLRSVAFLMQAFRSQLIGFRRTRRAPFPTLLCAGAMRSGQLFSVHIARRFMLGALHLYKCWITLCLCMKYPSKDNLPLPLLARMRDNRQTDGKMCKAAVRQS